MDKKKIGCRDVPYCVLVQNAGEQAVREFAEKIKLKVYPYEEVDSEDVCDDIDELFYKTFGVSIYETNDD